MTVVVTTVTALRLALPDEGRRIAFDHALGDQLDDVDRRGGAVLREPVVVHRAVVRDMDRIGELDAVDEDRVVRANLDVVAGVLEAPDRLVLVFRRVTAW